MPHIELVALVVRDYDAAGRALEAGVAVRSTRALAAAPNGDPREARVHVSPPPSRGTRFRRPSAATGGP